MKPIRKLLTDFNRTEVEAEMLESMKPRSGTELGIYDVGSPKKARSTRLLACPYCGDNLLAFSRANSGETIVNCFACGAQGIVGRSSDGMIEVWPIATQPASVSSSSK